MQGANEVAVPASWIILSNTHQRNKTCDRGCVIHNRTDHPMKYWPLHWRGDRGIFERVCPHGVGDQFAFWESTGQLWEQSIHGCDGCCKPAGDPTDSQDANCPIRDGREGGEWGCGQFNCKACY